MTPSPHAADLGSGRGPRQDWNAAGPRLRSLTLVLLPYLVLLVTTLARASGSADYEPTHMLARVPFRARTDLLPLHDSGARVRHLSDHWALVELAADRTGRLPPGSQVIAPVRPDHDYALVGRFGTPPPSVQVLLRWQGYALAAVPRHEWEVLHDAAPPHMALRLPVYRREALMPPLAPAFATPNELRDAAVRDVLHGFDETRWLDTIRRLAQNEGTESRYAFRVRDVTIYDGSPAPDDSCDRAADWILDEMRGLGYLVDDDPFSHVRFGDGFEPAVEYGMRNGIATKPGRGPNRDRVLLVTAHYDSVASRTDGWDENWRHMPAPGANDNATGVATVLEAARLLADVDLDFTVQFVLFSGEEIGLFGSEHLAEALRSSGTPVLGVLNTDMIGHDADGIHDLHVVADVRSEWMLQAIRSAAPFAGTTVQVLPMPGSDFVFSDHAPFWTHGYSAVLFSEESDFEAPEFAETYHTVEDVPSRINEGFGLQAARVVVASAAMLARPLVPGVPSVLPVQEQVSVIGASVFPNPFVVGADQPIRFQYQLNRPANVRVDVYDSRGGLVHAASFTTGGPHGRYGLNAPVIWDGNDQDGDAVPVGLYFVRIEATDPDRGVSQRTLKVVVVPTDAWARRYRDPLSPGQ